MSTKAVRSILEARLASWAAARSPALRVAYENTPFTPAAGETYLRAFLLPADTLSADLAGAHRGYRGVFQVSIVRPINGGPGPSLDIAAELNQQFPVNGRYTSGAVTVQVLTPASAAPALADESSYTVPVSFQYRADVI
ncbi:DUF4128 domain-containing protein [Lysobacter enzymogenes]|uniref:DUF4128 domain-containing protein n=1 Tax=Lysobacter enzymogenes TaxID=69 RepID=UPI001A959D95|nr:DUF4128 domain-containing protein [Lysobacter enzymogenes]QQP96547.1 DUF4128 domain-containing protein [Lysobacter enzymogenes]